MIKLTSAKNGISGNSSLTLGNWFATKKSPNSQFNDESVRKSITRGDLLWKITKIPGTRWMIQKKLNYQPYQHGGGVNIHPNNRFEQIRWREIFEKIPFLVGLTPNSSSGNKRLDIFNSSCEIRMAAPAGEENDFSVIMLREYLF